jgi:exonuclease SbcD
MALTFAHLADLHIGTENYGRIDPQTGLHTRLQDFVKCLEFAVDRILEEQVDFVLFVGDAYRTCDPTPTHEREFARQINRLSAAGRPVVLITGNHDLPLAFGRASAVDIFGTLDVAHVHVINRPQVLSLDTPGGPVEIACLPWPTRSMLLTRDEYKDLSEDQLRERIQEICSRWIASWAAQRDLAVPGILAAHLAAAEAQYSGTERSALIGSDPVFLTSTLAQPAFDYCALGHIHKFQDLHPSGSPHVVYPGSLERIDFGEARDEKGFCLVTIGDGPTPQQRVTTFQFIPTPARPFVELEVTVREGEDATARILRAIEQVDVTDAVVRIFYTAGDKEAGQLDLKAIQAALAPAFLVATISRRVEPTRSTARAEITEHLGLQEALDRYLATQPDLQPLATELKAYAERLEQEWEAARRR